MARSKKNTSRADKVRTRQSRSSRTPVKDSRGRSETPGNRMPPVMVRGSGYKPVRQTKKKRQTKNVKRRYDISVSTPGAPGVEIRLPSVPVMKISWKLLSMGLVVGLAFLLYYMLTAPVFQVRSVDVQGAIRLTAEELNLALNVVNQPIFNLNPSEIEQDLERNFEELKDVSIQIGLPAKVLVNVNERVPLIAWTQDSETKWIDGDGYAFPKRGETDNLVTVLAYASPPPPVQIHEGEEPIGLIQGYQAFMAPELVNAILSMRPQVPEETDLVYDPQHGLGWKDSRGWDVFFGIDGDEIDMKLQVYKSIAQKIKSEGITPALINLEHLHAPYYRMER